MTPVNVHCSNGWEAPIASSIDWCSIISPISQKHHWREKRVLCSRRCKGTALVTGTSKSHGFENKSGAVWCKPRWLTQARVPCSLPEKDEGNHFMEKEPQRMARQQVAVLMHRGTSWREATATAGVHVSRSTAYRWLKAWRTQGEAAFQDGRHGHVAKLREPVATALETLLKPTPEMPSREVQSALQKQFDISVSIGHLNRVRCQHGWSSRTARKKKNRSSPTPSKITPGDRE